MLPILPMHLINGQSGVGSGFSCNIVAYNPLDLCYWIEAKIKGLPLPKLTPWYRNFEGKIEVKDRNAAKEKKAEKAKAEKDVEKESESDSTEVELDDDGNEIQDEDKDVGIDKHTKFTMVTTGKYEEDAKKIHITELPIGRSIIGYKNYLDELREKKIITKYNNYSTTDKPNFEIFGMKTPSVKALKLTKSFGMSNMVLLDNENRPVKYETVDTLMETFYSIRLGYYVKRKEYIIQNIIETIITLNAKIRYILAVIKGYELLKTNPKITPEEALAQDALLVMNRKKKDIITLMEQGKYDVDLLQKVTFYHCTEDEVASAQEKLLSLEAEKTATENKKPESFWLEDLEKFTTQYCKHYKCEYISPKPLTLIIKK